MMPHDLHDADEAFFYIVIMLNETMHAECDFEPSPPSILSCPEDTCTVEEGEGSVVQVIL